MLDKTRAYVTIYGGVPEDGALYVQDGIRYFPNGDPIVKEAPKTAKKPNKAKSTEAVTLAEELVEAPAEEVSSDADGSIDDILSDVAE